MAMDIMDLFGAHGESHKEEKYGNI